MREGIGDREKVKILKQGLVSSPCVQDPEKKMKDEQDEEDRKKREEEEKKRKAEEGEWKT